MFFGRTGKCELRGGFHYWYIDICVIRFSYYLFVQMYRNLAEDVPKAGQVWDAFISMYSRDEAEEVFDSDSEYDEERKVQNLHRNI